MSNGYLDDFLQSTNQAVADAQRKVKKQQCEQLAQRRKAQEKMVKQLQHEQQHASGGGGGGSVWGTIFWIVLVFLLLWWLVSSLKKKKRPTAVVDTGGAPLISYQPQQGGGTSGNGPLAGRPGVRAAAAAETARNTDAAGNSVVPISTRARGGNAAGGLLPALTGAAAGVLGAGASASSTLGTAVSRTFPGLGRVLGPNNSRSGAQAFGTPFGQVTSRVPLSTANGGGANSWAGRMIESSEREEGYDQLVIADGTGKGY